MIEKIKIPTSIQISINSDSIEIKGKLGNLSLSIPTDVSIKYDSTYIYLYSNNKALLGTFISNFTRSLKGVSQGFVVKLQLVGIGYRFLEATSVLKLKVGFSHKMMCKIPENLKITILKPNLISISGINYQEINHFADIVRSVKTPEVYKGKGIKYLDEKIVLKETKKK